MKVYIIGCGGNARVIVDICRLLNYTIIGFFDDRYHHESFSSFCGYTILGKINDINSIVDKNDITDLNFINSIGDCQTRYIIYQKIMSLNPLIIWPNCIHPNSYISPSSKIGYGNVLCYGSVINSNTLIGNFNLINTYAVIEHDSTIGNFNHIAPKTVLCGNVHMIDLNLLGVGCSVLPGKIIGSSNIIGAMALVVNDIMDNQTIMGVPGKARSKHYKVIN